MSDLIDDLIECARLLGATQAKKGIGCYTREDARFERAMHESISDKAKRLTAERDKARAERDALADVLPGYYYMDPPDGGNVPVLEQLRRMAKDAERYRFLSCKGVPPYFHRCSRWRIEYWNGEWWDPLMKEELDAAIDAQIEKEERP